MKRSEMIDLLARIEHEQWAQWARYLLWSENGEPNISAERRKRWEKLINTDYSDLSEEWKLYDRIYANKVLRACEEAGVIQPKVWAEGCEWIGWEPEDVS